MKHTHQPFSVSVALRAIFEQRGKTHLPAAASIYQRRAFHEYFVTHLPSSSLSPDKTHSSSGGPQHHKLPRSESQPHSGPSSRSAANLQHQSHSRDTTIVRIPIKSAKHHFGAGVSRGSRPYNEDTYQAGTIEIPSFAKRQPLSVSRRGASGDAGEDVAQAAKSESGDPQVFFFGVFDGHGGAECSEFLRDRLHGYIEEAALLFGMESSLQPGKSQNTGVGDAEGGVMGEQDAESLQKSLVTTWGETVGGYFRRFKPEYFPALNNFANGSSSTKISHNSIETVLAYAFLKADLDFTAAQASKNTEDSEKQDAASASATMRTSRGPISSPRPPRSSGPLTDISSLAENPDIDMVLVTLGGVDHVLDPQQIGRLFIEQYLLHAVDSRA